MLVTDVATLRKLAAQAPYKLDLAAVQMVTLAQNTPSPDHYESAANAYKALIQAGAKPVSDGAILLDENVVNATKSRLADKELGRRIACDYLAGRPLRFIDARYGCGS